MSQLLFLFIVIQTFTSSLSILEPIPEDEKLVRVSLAQCVKYAADRFFSEGTILYLLPGKEVDAKLPSTITLDRLLLSELMKNCQWALTIKNTTKKSDDVTKPDYYLLQLRKIEDFFDDIKKLSNYSNWNPHGKFLIIAPRIVNSPRTAATEIMRELWRLHVVDGVILLPDLKNKTKFNAYSWFPYDKGNCGDDFDKVTYIDSCSFGRNSQFEDWYKNRIPNKFNNCTLKVKMVDLPPYVIHVQNNSWSNSSSRTIRGTEINLLDLIGNTCSLRMFYFTSRDAMNHGDVYANGTVTGNLKALQDETADISIGAYGKTVERSSVFDDSFYHYEDLIFCVPSSPKANNFESITSIIGPQTLLFTLMVYITLSALMWFNSANDIPTYKNFSACTFVSFGALLAFPVFLPKTTKVRYFFGLLLVYSFCFITAYQTLLTSALSNVTNEQKISTVTELLDSNMDIYAIDSVARYFSTDGTSKHTNRVNAAILKKWRKCIQYTKCFERVALKRDVAICFPKGVTEYFINSYRSSQNDPLIYCFEKSTVSYPITVMMRKGFQLFKRFDVLIARILSGGFMQKWERDIFNTRFENITSLNEEIVVGDTNLGIWSLKPIFGIWAVGCGAALVAFIGETIYWNWTNKKARK